MNSNQRITLGRTPLLPVEPRSSGERSEPPVASGTLLLGRLPLAPSILSRSAPPTPIHRWPHGSRIRFVQMPDQQPQPLQTYRLSHESFPNEPTPPLRCLTASAGGKIGRDNSSTGDR